MGDASNRQHAKRPLNFVFPKGSLIEVKSDEKGHKGALYTANVIAPPSNIKKRNSKRKRYNKIYVEYSNLLVDEDGPGLLREYVSVAFARPAPPPEEVVEGFEVNDVVDAFYKDGWWTGVVNKVLAGGSKFEVTFENSEDKRQFGRPNLRAHWDWIDGLWVRPVHPSISTLMFEVGRKVEVSLDKENRQGAWCPATILERLGNGSLLVEHESQNADDEAQHLKVNVHPLHIRPCPPLLKGRNFVLLEKVDAYFDNGWWSGVVTKELEDSRYIVFFKKTKKEREFHQSEIRPHMEWKDGKWFTSSQGVITSSDDGKHERCTTDTAVVGKDKMTHSLNFKGNLMDQSTPCKLDPSHVTTSLTKRRHSSFFYSLDTLSQRLKKLKEGNLAEAPSLASFQQSTLATLTTTFPYGSVSPTSENAITSSVELVPRDLSSNKPYSRRKIRKPRKVELDNPTSDSMEEKERNQMLQVESPGPVVGGKKMHNIGDIAGKVLEDTAGEETDFPIVVGLACSQMGSLTGKRARSSSRKESMKLVSGKEQQSNDSAMQNIKGSKQSETEVSIPKRKRGRPQKILSKSPRTPLTDVSGSMKQNGIVNEVEKVTPEESCNSVDDRPLSKWIEGTQTPTAVDGSNACGRKTMKSNGIVNEVEKVIPEEPFNNVDYETLSKRIGMQTTTAIDGSRVSPRTLEKCVVTSRKQKEIIMLTNGSATLKELGMQTSACEVDGSVVPNAQQSLPFVKNTMLWRTIESMEVFQRMPQKPHFQPLKCHKESSREGLALGFMVTFCSVVEKASSLQFNDPKSIADDILETLADLEIHGFDVLAVQDRITALLAMKDRQENLVGRVEEINYQIVEHTLEKAKIDEEIGEINNQIMNLEEKLSLTKSAIETKNLEIASLQSKLQEINDSVKKAVCDFEGLVVTPL